VLFALDRAVVCAGGIAVAFFTRFDNRVATHLRMRANYAEQQQQKGLHPFFFTLKSI
jgi:hypothetical protein